MKIITYNVNGLRAAVSKGLPEWLAKEQPDVLCLQETKLQPEQYPAEALDALGYRHYLHSARKKGYSGVAILTKREPDHVEYGMGMEEYDSEGRFVRADYGDLSVVSVYHPSGTRRPMRRQAVPATLRPTYCCRATSARPLRWSGWNTSGTMRWNCCAPVPNWCCAGTITSATRR